MTEPVQKIYNSIQEALMDYARLGVDAARRPKPQSLKEQALKEVDKLDAMWDVTSIEDKSLDTIRRALEALPND